MAFGINDSGTVVGSTFDSFGGNAVKWAGGSFSILDGLSVNGTIATAINNLGQIVGHSSLPNGAGSRALLWNGNSVTDLGQGLESYTYATGINDYGIVVGRGDSSGGSRGIVWQAGQTTTLQNGLGGTGAFPNAINELGEIVGNANDSNNSYRSVFWQSNQLETILPYLAGFSSSGTNALAINNHGQIVGSSNGYNQSRAVIWENDTITDLNTLLEPSVVDAGWKLELATGINDNGWIVGNAYNGALGFHAFLLKPNDVTAPATIALLGVGLAGIGAARRKQALSGAPGEPA